MPEPASPPPAAYDQWFGRRFLVFTQVTLIAVSLTLFYIALGQPASELPSFDAHRQTGWDCLLFGFVFWPSNALFLLSPFIAIVLAHVRGMALYVLTSILTFASGLFVGAAYFTARHPSPAFQWWATAHILMTLAMITPTWRSTSPAEKASDQYRRTFEAAVTEPCARR